MLTEDKAVAFNLIERAIAANPIEKDALLGPALIEILARVAAQMGEPDRDVTTVSCLGSTSVPGVGEEISGSRTFMIDTSEQCFAVGIATESPPHSDQE